MAPEKDLSSDRAEALRETLVALFDLDGPEREHIASVLRKVAPEDVGAVLGDFGLEEKLVIYRALPSNEVRGIVLDETDQQSRRDIASALSESERLEALGELPPDDLVDQLEELPAEEQARVIATLEAEEAKEVEELLQYAPETAGGMMTTEFISVRSHFSSREALERIQGNLTQEVIAYVYVLEDDDVLVGVASIRGILKAKPVTPIKEHMTRDPVSVKVDTDREEVASVMSKYNHAALPVVDAQGRMRGVITFDDVFDAVEEEHSEDMLRMAGTVAINPFYEPVFAGIIKRLPFLVLTMIGGFGIIAVKEMFEEGLPPEMVAAPIVIPLLIGLSGNVGIVTSTIMVRGLATGDINLERFWRALGKELAVGVVLAVVLGGAVALVLRLAPFSNLPDALPQVLGLSLVGSVVFSALLGGLIPLACRFTGVIDPAIASGPFVTMLCDLSGSFIFFLLLVLIL